MLKSTKAENRRNELQTLFLLFFPPFFAEDIRFPVFFSVKTGKLFEHEQL